MPVMTKYMDTCLPLCDCVCVGLLRQAVSSFCCSDQTCCEGWVLEVLSEVLDLEDLSFARVLGVQDFRA